MPTVRIESPERRERRALLEVLARAFRDNPMNRAIHGPDPARRLRANRAGLRSLVLDLHPWTRARVIRNEGRVVGGFIAVPPGGFPVPGASIGRQLGCLFWQGARAMDRWGFVTEALRLEHPLDPRWYVAAFGVDPSVQGQGFGGRLLDALHDLVATLPRPIYLESDRPESVAFYRSRGFETVGELRLLGVSCWRMGCDPRPSSSGEHTDLCDAPDRRYSVEGNLPTVEASRAARSEVAP